jgi:molybdate transport system substrate-binding protein
VTGTADTNASAGRRDGRRDPASRLGTLRLRLPVRRLRFSMWRTVGLGFVVGSLIAPGVSAASAHGAQTVLRVAAAADLKFALDELISEFHAAHPGTRVEVSYGSSGNFFAQLQNRAPFDVYFSAEVSYPRKLAAAGHALDGDVFLYAVGRIVVWARNSAPIDVAARGIRSLLEPGVRKVAIANPQHAPYGAAAVEAMEALGVYEEIKSRLVYGENVAQTAQFVQSGAADVGILALALALAPSMQKEGRYWEIPLDAYSRIDQGGMIPAWATQPDAARALRDFVLEERGRGVLARYGFSLPER